MIGERQKILIFSLDYFPRIGGAEIAIREICRRSPDFSYILITSLKDSTLPRQELIGNVWVIRVGFGLAALDKYCLPLFGWWRGLKEQRREKLALVWGVMANTAGLAALFLKLTHPQIPYLLTLQEGDPPEYYWRRVWFWYPLYRLIYQKADHIQVISNYLKAWPTTHGYQGAVDVIPNGVDLKNFMGNLFEKLPDSDPVVITSSRLAYKNGIDILIRAVALLKAQGHGLKALVVGDGPERKSLEKLAADLGITNELTFFGRVPYEYVPQFLERAAVFVRPSRSEGLGNSFLEAMAMGLTVVGTPVGGIPDFLQDGVTGFLVEPNSPAALAEKLRWIFANRALAAAAARNGQKLVQENYSWDKAAAAMTAAFQRLIFTKKVLLATGIFPPDIGGPATNSKVILEKLPRLGFKVAVVSFGERAASDPPGISRVSMQWPKGLRHLIYCWQCWQLGKEADVFFVQGALSAGWPALAAAKLLGKPLVVRIVGDAAWEISRQQLGVLDNINEFQDKRYGWSVELLRRLQNFVVQRANLVVVPSHYLAGLVAGWRVPSQKIKVVYNAFALPELEFSKNEARRNLSLNDEKIIVSAGRLVVWKGFDMLIELVKELTASGLFNLKLFIIGGGPEETKLRSLAGNHDSGKIVLTGVLPQEELLKYLAAADVFLLNTGYEGLSHQILEAAAVGLPVVTTNIGGNPELVKDGENGFLVQPGDKEAFRDRLLQLFSDQDLAERFSRNGREFAKSFSQEAMLSQLVNVFNSLI